jgi:Uncharacterized protein conserved in bacteria (DUF2330)
MWWLAEIGTAWACGGFFCNNAAPVEQTGETVVFEVQDGSVTVHAQIAFQGDAASFAWVLPVNGVPDLFLSWQALFDTLWPATDPLPSTTFVNAEGCDWNAGGDADTDADTDADSDTSTETDPSPFVTVLSTEEVGPYEGVVLAASSSSALVEWLQTNGYGVPDTLESLAAPYLADEMNFLALKLAPGQSVGDLRPLGVKWEGERPSIPITLTAVAATDDLPLSVFVFGDHRAVPLSYLHVQLNPLVYDWLGSGVNWLERVGIAANEAGGRAFATTFAGPTPWIDVQCPYDTAGLETLKDPLTWFLALGSHGFGGSAEVLEVLRTYVPAPMLVDEQAFYNDPYSYASDWEALRKGFDPVAATAALEELIVTPCTDARAMIDRNPHLTRLTSLMSPDEMTVDPVFGFNPDLPDVERALDATYDLRNCATGTGHYLFPGGFGLEVTEVDANGLATQAYLDDALRHHALVIEQLSESGPGTILADYRSDFDAQDPATTPDDDPGGGSPGDRDCGCSSTRGGALGWWLAAVAVGTRRGRRPGVVRRPTG